MPHRRKADTPEMQIAPMIDCVFLMLIYFMTTSSLDRTEADLPCPIGGVAISADPLPAIDEQSLVLGADGAVNWNGSVFILTTEEGRKNLLSRLLAFEETCSRAGSEPSLRIQPEDAVSHQILVRLIDEITKSGIAQVHFP
jgi:biopolymer transport protein ExbD